MTVKLNQRAYEHAKKLIGEGKLVNDEREAWSEHHPSTRIEKEFIQHHGFIEYGNWFLAVNDDHPEDKRRHYEFPYGDFAKVHRCAILAAQSRTKGLDIENAVTALLELMDNWAHG